MKKVLIGSLSENSRFKLVPNGSVVYRVVSVTPSYVHAIRNSRNIISFSLDYKVFV